MAAAAAASPARLHPSKLDSTHQSPVKMRRPPSVETTAGSPRGAKGGEITCVTSRIGLFVVYYTTYVYNNRIV
jgi:hypothetical protein